YGFHALCLFLVLAAWCGLPAHREAGAGSGRVYPSSGTQHNRGGENHGGGPEPAPEGVYLRRLARVKATCSARALGALPLRTETLMDTYRLSSRSAASSGFRPLESARDFSSSLARPRKALRMTFRESRTSFWMLASQLMLSHTEFTSRQPSTRWRAGRPRVPSKKARRALPAL